HLGVRPGEVDARRYEREPALLDAALDAVDLAPVGQQLARALGIVVVARRRAVGRNVHVVQPQLAVADAGVAVLELCPAGAQRLDLRALQHDAALQALEQVVAKRRVAVARHVARPDLLAFALGHPVHEPYIAGSRTTRPRGGSTRTTRTDTSSPRRSARPERVPNRIVPCSLSSHQSPRMRRTGNIPS